ncbi:MAG TPA: hypothetical protein VM597_08910 [Gemmataceae bacterium]|nr:hypothetical protein [Gemmataceae bacterium]
MATERQRLASRLNGCKSNGPHTAAGKAVSSLNAVRHGIFSNMPVLSGLGESAADRDAFRDAVVSALAPVGEAELALSQWYAHLRSGPGPLRIDPPSARGGPSV